MPIGIKFSIFLVDIERFAAMIGVNFRRWHGALPPLPATAILAGLPFQIDGLACH